MNRILLILTLGFVLSCANQPKKIPQYTGSEAKQVKCSDNEEHTYRFMVVGEGENLPLIVVLDPHADSKKAVNLVSEAANFMPCIVACSDLIENNSKEYIEVLDELIKDVKGKHSIDETKIVLVGFSGGARMALNYSREHKVGGLMMCGAGPGQEMPDFPFYGLIGLQDFNFIELYQRPVTTFIGDRSFVLDFFRGKHEWPQSDRLKDGLLFLTQQHNEKNRESARIRSREMYAQSDRLKGKGIESYKILEKSFQLSDDAAIKEELKEKIKLLGEDKSFKVQVQSLENNLKLENTLKQQYINRSLEADVEYWKEEIKILKEKSMYSSNTYEIDHSERMMGFLGILFYSRLQVLSYVDGKEDLVKTLLSSFALLEPKNPDMFYFKVVYHTKMQEMDSAGYYLDLARENGLKE